MIKTDPTSPAEIFLQKLRAETTLLHKQLEKNAYTRELVEDSLTPSYYLDYLKQLYGYIYPFEMYYFPQLSDAVPDIDERFKSDLLEQDILFLEPGTDFEALPLFPFHPDETKISALLGKMYVLEGSTLGGKLIGHQVNKKLGYDEKGGASYLRVYGHENGIRWKNFLQYFSSFILKNKTAEVAITAARETFLEMDMWMSRQL